MVQFHIHRTSLLNVSSYSSRAHEMIWYDMIWQLSIDQILSCLYPLYMQILQYEKGCKNVFFLKWYNLFIWWHVFLFFFFLNNCLQKITVKVECYVYLQKQNFLNVCLLFKVATYRFPCLIKWLWNFFLDSSLFFFQYTMIMGCWCREVSSNQ